MTFAQKLVSDHIGIARLKASIDPYFNDIPLSEWDTLAQFLSDYRYLGERVSALKDAARALIGGKPIDN